MTLRLLSKAEYAAEIGITPRHVGRLEKDGLPTRRKGGKTFYPAPLAIVWYVNRAKGHASRTEHQDAILRREWARAARAERARWNLHQATTRTDDARRFLAEVRDELRAIITAWPASAAPLAIGCTSMVAAQQRLSDPLMVYGPHALLTHLREGGTRRQSEAAPARSWTRPRPVDGESFLESRARAQTVRLEAESGVAEIRLALECGDAVTITDTFATLHTLSYALRAQLLAAPGRWCHALVNVRTEAEARAALERIATELVKELTDREPAPPSLAA